MKIGILTSSRADYGIYYPLLMALKEDPFFSIEIIAFGTHLSPFHGYTIDYIIKDGFEVNHRIETVVAGDSEDSITTSMGITLIKFSEFWKIYKREFDLVFCLGDRYEMFAAISSGIPFNVHFAHLHGGERTLGAIDNVFRHSITLASKIHFTACEEYKQRVIDLIESKENVFNVGALSLDNLISLSLLSVKEMYNQFGIDFNIPTILSTIHPETVSIEKNNRNIIEICKVFKNLENFQVVITMPNADTEGTKYREAFLALEKNYSNITCVENFGSKGYFSAMKHCYFLLGNSSSGLIEAASLKKYVINVGIRQQGRLHSNNVIHVPFDEQKINNAVKTFSDGKDYMGTNIFYNGGAVNKIIKTLKGIK